MSSSYNWRINVNGKRHYSVILQSDAFFAFKITGKTKMRSAAHDCAALFLIFDLIIIKNMKEEKNEGNKVQFIV